MRQAMVDALVELAKSDPRVFLLTADLGWNVLESFRTSFPTRFLNVGVAEQNMAGIATGLAQVGYVPFIYSIATFATMRCYEQIRNGALLHNLPLRILGMGGGYAYGHAGPTHYALEDIAILRAQPGMTVLVPADSDQARACILASRDLSGPVYLRIGKDANRTVVGLNGRFRFDGPEVIRDGNDALLLTCGSIAQEVLIAADLLNDTGLSTGVAVMAHLPFQAGPELIQLISKFPLVVTVEESYINGGIGSLAAELVARSGLKCRLISVGATDPINCDSGTEAFMRSSRFMDAQSIAKAVQEPREAATA
jgi:transketolase